MSLILRNGQVWESQAGERAITQWLGGDLWCLLGLPIEAPHGGTQMVPLAVGEGRTLYAGDVLTQALAKNHWRRQPRVGMQLPEAQAVLEGEGNTPD